MIGVVDLDAATAEWAPEGTYVNTASYGLPPARAWTALQDALADWRGGRTSWEPWTESTEAARASFARLVGVPVARVAVGATVSGLVGLIAASLPDGVRVLAPEIEFTSNLFPYMVQAGRGVEVHTVPARRLAEAVDATTDVVAFSAVQMSTGEVADLEAVEAAARHHGALTVVDATQACGWLPLEGTRFDAVACSAYKWLMSPKGTAFLTVSAELLERIVPHSAGWYAGEDVFESYAGPPLRLARSGRRLDTSPAWFSWVERRPPSPWSRRSESTRSRRTTSAWRMPSARVSGCRPPTRRSCPPSSPASWRACAVPESWPPSSKGGCARRGTSTTHPTMSSGHSRSSHS